MHELTTNIAYGADRARSKVIEHRQNLYQEYKLNKDLGARANLARTSKGLTENCKKRVVLKVAHEMAAVYQIDI
jgi:hypothetical protein